MRRIAETCLICLPMSLRQAILQRVRRKHQPGVDVLQEFIKRCKALPAPRVVELGTRRSQPQRSTKHAEWVPHASECLGCDLRPGIDVDIVSDAHQLSQAAGVEAFDVLLSCSTMEHFKYPHLAAHEIMKTVRVGGLVFIQTHHAFPLHAHPSDYFRFSREALAGLFGTRMGFSVIATDYEYPCEIHSPYDRYAHAGPAYLNVRLLGQKTSATPEEYIYEFTYAHAT